MSEAAAIQKREETAVSIKGLESALLDADLGKMNEATRLQYYTRVCESLGLNPLTQPFEYIKLNNKLVLYARRSCTEQLRKMQGVSVEITSRVKADGLYVVTARATTRDGRTDESIGAVPVDKLTGENLSNALMKAETKAKRRVTLSICGLAFLDESEADSIPGAVRGEPKAATVRTLDSVAAEGASVTLNVEGGKVVSGQTRQAEGEQRQSPIGSIETRAHEAGAGQQAGSSPAVAERAAPAATDGELLDAKAWRKRYELLCEELMQPPANWIFGQDDEFQLPMPPVECPVFGPKGKLAGKRYDDTTVGVGFLRKLAADERFDSGAADVRCWILYLVARHELAKEQAP